MSLCRVPERLVGSFSHHYFGLFAVHLLYVSIVQDNLKDNIFIVIVCFSILKKSRCAEIPCMYNSCLLEGAARS